MKPTSEHPTPAQDPRAENRSAPAALTDRGDLPLTEILRRLEQVADRLEAVCAQIQPSEIDRSLASVLFSRLDGLEDKLDQLSAQARERTSSATPTDANPPSPEPDQPAEPATSDASVVEFLATSSPFANYSTEACNLLAQFMDQTALAAGSVLFSQGQRGDALYLVKSGLLEIYKTDASGEVHVADVQPGELVGEMALIDDLPRSAGVRAKQNAELLVLSRASYRDLQKTYPPLAVKLHKELLAILSARLRKTTDKAVGGRNAFA